MTSRACRATATARPSRCATRSTVTSRAIHAEIDPDGLRRVEWQYVNGGRIEVRVDPVLVAGVPVPRTEDAEIQLPAYHVVAHATFSDYKIVADAPESR